MTIRNPLPLSDEWKDPDEYVNALLSFATESVMFMNLCGGVHVLDFLTRDPDLYTSLLPEDWRSFFDHHDIHSILQLLLREDIGPLCEPAATNADTENGRTWNGGAFPPTSLLEYIRNIRRLSFSREYTTSEKSEPLPRHIAVGMNKKKKHEVEEFSRYVASLSETVSERRGEPLSHIVDFGSGQNYLGRMLASPPYHKHIIAIERKHQYISGANRMDVVARLTTEEKKKTMHNAKLNKMKKQCLDCTDTPELAPDLGPSESEKPGVPSLEMGAPSGPSDSVHEESARQDEDATISNMLGDMTLEAGDMLGSMYKKPHVPHVPKARPRVDARGTVSYIEHNIQDGYLEPIIEHVVDPKTSVETRTSTEEVIIQPEEKKPSDARVMVVSLHSCGNLVHHGVRSLVLNPSVVAIAMIGCCYNLLTERLGPATYKIPILRSSHPRLKQTGSSWDPHGFPMSKLYENYQAKTTKGLKLNITARSMALQAPHNWGRADSEDFFTRHFYRALLQRVLLDRDIIPKPDIPDDLYKDDTENPNAEGIALIVGSVRKSAFESFTAYVRAATVKLSRDPTRGELVKERVCTMSEEELQSYENEYLPGRKNLSIVWSLMAFSAQVVEAAIVVDRWQFLREHDSVKECWVEPVFEYGQSPRNLAIIGIKK
uniref:Methyltransferase domain-containing protein n=1 Tax=Penicillium aethiopicum TaxID=36650 RepID=D7PI01_PENAE|nr:unknown [Penicillium aethiopicum]